MKVEIRNGKKLPILKLFWNEIIFFGNIRDHNRPIINEYKSDAVTCVFWKIEGFKTYMKTSHQMGIDNLF